MARAEPGACNAEEPLNEYERAGHRPRASTQHALFHRPEHAGATFSAPAMGQLGRSLDGGFDCRQIRDEASTKVLGRCCPRCLLPSCVDVQGLESCRLDQSRPLPWTHRSRQHLFYPCCQEIRRSPTRAIRRRTRNASIGWACASPDRTEDRASACCEPYLLPFSGGRGDCLR